MRSFLGPSLFLALAGFAGVVNAAQTAASLWQEMAITTTPNDPFPFAITDNRAGYFEGITGRYDGGVGYRYRETTLMQDCVSSIGSARLDRHKKSNKASYLPFSISHHYEHAAETLLVHSGQAIISCRVQSDEPAKLGIATFNLFEREFDIIERGKIIVIKARRNAHSDVPSFVAVSASQQIELVEKPSPVDSNETTVDVQFRGRQSALQLIVQFSFANSAKEARRLASQHSANERWSNEEITRYNRLSALQFRSDDEQYNRALWWAHASAQSFVVEQFGRGIWAGLPWFRDNWGRDTFIALPGTSLVNGDFVTAKKIIENFWAQQFLANKSSPLYGRIPNRIAADRETIYNTVDGTPWLIRELYEYALYSGDVAYALKQLPRIDAYIAGVKRHWLDRNGLLTHEDADTWMDARIDNQQAWSPRGNRAVEIQALWITALDVAIRLHQLKGHQEQIEAYQLMATQARDSFLKLYWQEDVMADRLRADNTRDTTVRPNQLMTISIPLTPILPAAMQNELVRNVAQELLLPYGVLSLSPMHTAFHPVHQHDAKYHKDAAYHNGTIWGWISGPAITALTRVGQQDLAWQLSRNLSQQILSGGHRGSMSELVDATLDAQGSVKPSGTYAQAWSVAEFVRNAYQDYLGFKPDLINDVLELSPALPASWRALTARLRVGVQSAIDINMKIDGARQIWKFTPEHLNKKTLVLRLKTTDQQFKSIAIVLHKKAITIDWDGSKVLVNKKDMSDRLSSLPSSQEDNNLIFRSALTRDLSVYSVTQEIDQLKQRILANDPVF